jgi:putative FmdB family regulatory protein
MPLYDFQCGRCGHRFEELAKLGEIPPCPRCGYLGPERLFSASAGVSTETTRSKALGQARRAASKVSKEKAHAQREYERNYLKDHS